MSRLTIRKLYKNGRIFRESHLDAIKTDIEDKVNISSTPMYAGSKGLDDDNIQDDTITTAKIAPFSVSTGTITASTITRDKLEALGQQTSSNITTFTTTATTSTPVTGLSTTITTTGRPVYIGLMSSGNANPALIEAQDTAGAGDNLFVYIKRDSTVIYTIQVKCLKAAGVMDLIVNPDCVFTIEQPSANTYTYSIETKYSAAAVGRDIDFEYMKLVAWEF